MNRILLAEIIIVSLVLPSVSFGYSGGSGEPNDPYRIATKADLLELASTPEDYNKCFILTADINMQDQVFTTAIIAPDTNSDSGFQGTDFTGVFDGNSHKITNFTIDKGSNDYLGLFGRINSDGSIENINLEDCVVRGNRYVGGLVGYNNAGSIINCYSAGSIGGNWHAGGLVGHNYNGNINNCYSTGVVNGVYEVGGLVGCNNDYGIIINCYSAGTVGGTVFVGGLVGSNKGSVINCCTEGTISAPYDAGGLVGDNYGNINNCYSTAAISCSSNVGGLVGYNNDYGIIINCYSTGTVSGSATAGGLVGHNSYATSISNCYSTGAVSGTSDVGGLVGSKDYSSNISRCYFLINSGPDNGYGTPLNDEQMKQQASFIGWDFIDESANGTSNYWQMPPDAYPELSVFGGYIPPELNGSGTENDPYIITDANDLGTVWYRPSAHYVLTNDINISETQWSVAVAPVFNGVFDGNDFGINNFFINGGGHLGLFGKVNPGSNIKNLALQDCTVIGTGYYVGGLAGKNCGNISNCYSAGNVSDWDDYVGGLVGENRGNVSNCYSTGNVSGGYYVGGLLGGNRGSIAACYSTSTVSGGLDVGGLVGSSQSGSSINNCYSIGAISGGDNVGGLVGASENNTSINDCYTICDVDGSRYVGGLVGDNSGSISKCYSTGLVTSSSYYIGGLVGLNSGSIDNCCSRGNVSGTVSVGGLVGKSYECSITNCYSSGTASGDSEVGGLVGRSEAIITNCYFLITSGPDNGFGQPLTDAQMKQQASFIDWDFVAETANGTDDIWRMCVDGIDYPLLWWQFNPADFTCPDGVNFIDFAVLANAWLTDSAQDNWNPRCDIAEPPDETIDVSDLAVFAQNWLQQE